MRDQLDRFGEIDTTAELLHTVAYHTTKGVVINRDDPRLSGSFFIDSLTVPVATYGVAPRLLTAFPTDDTLRDTASAQTPSTLQRDDTSLERVSGQQAQLQYGGVSHDVVLQLKGIYNVQNAVGAVAMTRMIMGPQLDETAMFAALAAVTPAFGRGESIKIGDKECELVLVKNPAGFRLSLKSFDSNIADTMIAINDDYADGRDMSWLWDVDFESLHDGVSMVSGLRAYDMALRLQYDEIAMGHVEPILTKALRLFLSEGDKKTKRIYCTYTAMLTLRRELGKLTDIEVVR